METRKVNQLIFLLLSLDNNRTTIKRPSTDRAKSLLLLRIAAVAQGEA